MNSKTQAAILMATILGSTSGLWTPTTEVSPYTKLVKDPTCPIQAEKIAKAEAKRKRKEKKRYDN